jgi:hypothetical protein
VARSEAISRGGVSVVNPSVRGADLIPLPQIPSSWNLSTPSICRLDAEILNLGRLSWLFSLFEQSESRERQVRVNGVQPGQLSELQVLPSTGLLFLHWFITPNFE